MPSAQRLVLAVPSVPQLAELKKLGRFLFYPVVANNSKKGSLVTVWISEQIRDFSNHALTSKRYGLLRLVTPSRGFLSH
jgi:hypothetical protein